MEPILSPNDLEQLKTLIDDAHHIVVCCHTHPDGDAIGSCLGWTNYLRSKGKEAVVIIPNMHPDFLKWLPNSEKIVRYDKKTDFANQLIDEADIIFMLDLNQPDRLAEMAEAVMHSRAKKAIIDHHLDPIDNVEFLCSHPEACSTCELVFRVVWELGDFAALGTHFAAPIYCGMMTDTGGFTYNSNSSDVFFIISQLLTKGVDKDRIYRNVFHCFSENRLRLMGSVLYKKLMTFEEQHAALFALSRADQQRFHFVKGDAEGLVNLPLQMKGTRLSISLREDTEKERNVRVSLRSVDNFPCNIMAARYFNGGGHLNASGGELHCTLEEAIDIATKAIMEFQPDNSNNNPQI